MYANFDLFRYRLTDHGRTSTRTTSPAASPKLRPLGTYGARPFPLAAPGEAGTAAVSGAGDGPGRALSPGRPSSVSRGAGTASANGFSPARAIVGRTRTRTRTNAGKCRLKRFPSRARPAPP